MIAKLQKENSIHPPTVTEKNNLIFPSEFSCFLQNKTGEIPMLEPPTFIFVEVGGVRKSEKDLALHH